VIEGSKTPALVVKNVAKSTPIPSFSVRVSNAFGSVTTPAVELRTIKALSSDPPRSAPSGGTAANAAAPRKALKSANWASPSSSRSTWSRATITPSPSSGGATASSFRAQPTPAYTIAKITDSDAGAYDAVISAMVKGEEKGRVISAATLLKILAPPTIAPMAPQTVRPGQRALLVPVVSGGANLVLSWSKVQPDGTRVPVSGAGRSVNPVTGVLSIDAATDADSGVYELFAKDDNSDTGRTAQVTSRSRCPSRSRSNPA
jgi:hypothetical protein